MMTTHMGYCTISLDGANDAQLLASLVDFFGAEPCNAWLEDERRAVGFEIRDNVAVAEIPSLLGEWPEGRIFTNQADLRWERQTDGRAYLTVISDAEIPAGMEGVTELQPVDGPKHLFLWGTKSSDHWEERRIPRIDQRLYPTSWNGPFAVIDVNSYEAPWESGGEPAVRRVMRYHRFRGDFDPAQHGAETVFLAVEEEGEV